VAIPKTDRFTGAAYPFNAHRLESVIETVLRLGFSLERLEHWGTDQATFILAFRKRTPPEAGTD
jgi:hypothetical protein